MNAMNKDMFNQCFDLLEKAMKEKNFNFPIT